jgi:septum formation topological specificity factor MinE
MYLFLFCHLIFLVRKTSHEGLNFRLVIIVPVSLSKMLLPNRLSKLQKDVLKRAE